MRPYDEGHCAGPGQSPQHFAESLVVYGELARLAVYWTALLSLRVQVSFSKHLRNRQYSSCSTHTLCLSQLWKCRHRDFLPFTCDCCHKVYCLEHRTYTGHDCPKADNKASTTVVCPLCARAIRIAYGQDPNVIFEEHQTQVCSFFSFL